MTADEYIQAAPTLVLYDSLTKTRSVLEQYQNVLVSVSGGADSDDMVDVVEHLKTERQRITYVWFDTGIEMAATKRHLADLQEKYKIEIKHEKGAMPVAGAVKSVGYPFYSKNFSESIYRLQRHGFEWEDEPFDVLLKKYPNCRAALRWWCNNYKDGPHRPLQTEIGSARGMKEFMVKNPPNFLISKRCCDEAKKKPLTWLGESIRQTYSLRACGVQKAARVRQQLKAVWQTVRTGNDIIHCFGGEIVTRKHLRLPTALFTVTLTRFTAARAQAAQGARSQGILKKNLKCFTNTNHTSQLPSRTSLSPHTSTRENTANSKIRCKLQRE